MNQKNTGIGHLPMMMVKMISMKIMKYLDKFAITLKLLLFIIKPEDTLIAINDYLRSTHHYCVWCSIAFTGLSLEFSFMLLNFIVLSCQTMMICVIIVLEILQKIITINL